MEHQEIAKAIVGVLFLVMMFTSVIVLGKDMYQESKRYGRNRRYRK